MGNPSFDLPATHTFAQWESTIDTTTTPPTLHVIAPGSLAWLLIREAVAEATAELVAEAFNWLHRDLPDAREARSIAALRINADAPLEMPADPLAEAANLPAFAVAAAALEKRLVSWGFSELAASAKSRQLPPRAARLLLATASEGRLGSALMPRPADAAWRLARADARDHVASSVLGAPFALADIAIPLAARKHLPDGQVSVVDPLQDLRAWLDQPDIHDSLRLLDGALGSGRTGTAMQLAADAPPAISLVLQDLAGPGIFTSPAELLHHLQATIGKQPPPRVLLIIDNADGWLGSGRHGRGARRELVQRLIAWLGEVNRTGLRLQILLIGQRLPQADAVRLAIADPAGEGIAALQEQMKRYCPAMAPAPRGRRLLETILACLDSAKVAPPPAGRYEALLMRQAAASRLDELIPLAGESASWRYTATRWIRCFGHAPCSDALHLALRHAVAKLAPEQARKLQQSVAACCQRADELPIELEIPQASGASYMAHLLNTQLGILSVLQACCLATGEPTAPREPFALGAWLHRLHDYHDLRGFLAGLDLSHADLADMALGEINVSGAKLVGIHAHRTDLRGAVLAGCDLTDADLTNADLRGADLAGANLRGAKLAGASLDGVDFADTHLERADLSGHDFHGHNFERANLEGAIFRNARLTHATFRYAHLEGADLRGANLDNAQLQDATLIGADLRGASLVDANLKGARLTRARLEKANLQGAILRKADIRDTILDKR